MSLGSNGYLDSVICLKLFVKKGKWSFFFLNKGTMKKNELGKLNFYFFIADI